MGKRAFILMQPNNRQTQTKKNFPGCNHRYRQHDQATNPLIANGCTLISTKFLFGDRIQNKSQKTH
jgi:hypothetical protein